MTIEANSSSPASRSAAAATNEAANESQASPNVPFNQRQSSHQVHIVKKNRHDVIKTIQEIAKVDEYTINQAIEACQDSEGRYSMDQVLNILMDENFANNEQSHDNSSRTSLSRGANPAGSSSSSSQTNETSLHKSRGTTNLPGQEKTNDYAYGATNNLEEDEDDDYETISASSLAQLISSPKPLAVSAETHFLRDDGKPAGLKNVGNTCWFNSIIQALFHLPAFRRLVLGFQIDQSDFNRLDDNSRNVVLFVAELRKLFALMQMSKRRSINPNPILKLLRSCSKYDADMFNQEDVSEFATILVNLIEESFDILNKIQQQNQQLQLEQQQPSSDSTTAQHVSTSPNLKQSTLNNQSSPSMSLKPNQASANAPINSRKNRRNPIVNLLYGDILINRKNSDEEETHSLIEIFREVNIQMVNARNLHAGLELEWGETSIDKGSTNLSPPPTATSATSSSSSASSAANPNLTGDKANKEVSFYEQETWLFQLPPVMFICLNRYKFVKATQSSSKIIEPFDFYPHVYLDRYLYTNRETVKEKRKQLQVFKSELRKLEEKLKSIKNYKLENANTNFALDDVLKCALQFATTDYSLDEIFNTIKPITRVSNEGEEASKETSNLSVVRNCLKNWIDQIESKIDELQREINEVKEKIDTIFDEDQLKKVRYNLHSVCIHEGNATSGHFWTYIWNPAQKKWYKHNDTEVSESNWDDLYANAVGGNQNKDSDKNNEFVDANFEVSKASTERTPSAYFLVYVKAEESSLDQESVQLDVGLSKLLNEDQEHLENQIYNYKLKQLLCEAHEKLKKTEQSIAEANKLLQNPPGEQNNQTCLEHAKAFNDSTLDMLKSSLDRILPNKGVAITSPINMVSSGLEDALKNSVELELLKYSVAQKDVLLGLPEIDLRLNHILIYFNCNNVSREIKTLALYDLFRIQLVADNSIKLKLMQTLAQIKYNEFVLASLTNAPGQSSANLNPDLFKNYEKLQADYRDFRSIIAAFISAANFLESQRYEEATTFFCVACEYNERITQNLTNKMKGMDHEVLLLNRRKSIKLWNQCAIRKIRNSPLIMGDGGIPTPESIVQQEITSQLEIMITKFLPCFFRLATSSNEDKAMIDEIRQDWLNVIDDNLPEYQVYHDFMTKLFEDPIANHYHSLNVNKTNLPQRYKDSVQTLQKIRISHHS